MSAQGIEGMFTFTYYDDLDEAERFFRDVMGFEKVIDVDFAKVYRVAGNSHVGLVDSSKGFLKTSEDKPVMLTFVVDDIEAWNQRLKEANVEITQPPKEAAYLRMKTMLFKDPEGYVLEVLEFLKKPYGH